jgi:transposase-like protein
VSIEGNRKIIDELTERSEKWEAKTPRRTPHKGAASVNNSNTSPKKVVIRRNQARALTYREQGYTYEQIAAQMKRPPQTIHRWVTQAMDRLIDEPARRVLALELRRLDRLQSAVYHAAADGDLAAIRSYLDIADRRAKLLGLYPKEGQHAAVTLSRSDEKDEIKIEFVMPPKVIDEPEPVNELPYRGEPRPAATIDNDTGQPSVSRVRLADLIPVKTDKGWMGR